jgi:hypothetical protein
MTGKGNRSRNNRSVMKPATIDWAKDKGFHFEEKDDHFVLFVVIE